MARRLPIRPSHLGPLLGLIITLSAILALQGLPFFARAELAAYDFQLEHRTSPPSTSGIVFVGVDKSSIEDLNGGSYPLPRRLMAQAVNFLHRAGAKAIGLDFYYPRQTPDDTALATALRRAGNVVVGQLLSTPEQASDLLAELRIIPPPAAIARAARAGLVNVQSDHDNVYRSANTSYAGPGGTCLGCRQYPTFAAVLAAVAEHRPVSQIMRQFPRHFWINYAGAQLAGAAGFQTVDVQTFEGLFNSGHVQDHLSVFQNKIVVIGCAAIECLDVKSTPYGDMYGGVLQINILNTILRNIPIEPIDNTQGNLIILLLGALITLTASRFRLWASVSAAVLVAVGYAIITMLLFDRANLWLPLIVPEVAVILSFTAIMAMRFATEEHQKRKMRRIFGEYVKPEIVDILVRDQSALTPVRRPVSVLFVDIRGFTAMSETMQPEAVVAVLDVYLEELTQSVQRFDGTVDKYVGDELMAIWNAPSLQEDHCLRAVRCALDMVGRIEAINEKLRARSLPQISFGIGVNSGEAVVGRMGSTLRKQYTVIGDTVNTGARLCGAAAKGQILIGQETWQLIGNRLDVMETAPLKLKGKSQPLRTFQILGVHQAAGEAAPAVARA